MSLRPVKRSRRKHSRRPLLSTQGNWNFNWKPDKLWTKRRFAIIFLALAISMIFAIGKYPGGPLPIVMGDYNSSFSHTRTLIFGDTQFLGPTGTSIFASQNSSATNDAQAGNNIDGVGADTREGQCFNKFSSSFNMVSFNIALKRVGTPTGTVTSQVWDLGAGDRLGATRGCTFNNMGFTSGSTIAMASIPTTYALESLTLSFTFNSVNTYAFLVSYSFSR